MKDQELLEVFFKTVNHFYPQFISKWLNKVPDPRNVNKTDYNIGILLLEGIFLFLFKLGSRRDINFKLNTKEFIRNISTWIKSEGMLKCSQEQLEKLPDEDTLAYLLKRLDPRHLSKLRTRMVERLIRMRALESYRLLGKYYLIVIDGTWELKFKHKHCNNCLRMKIGVDKKGNPVYIYYHAVLEAKLVTACGLALSIATEFIENTDINEGLDFEKQKQDCELKAFYRLVPKLKKSFPQLKMCLVLDSLYAGKPTFDICKNHHFKYIITFKEGSMPETFKEFETLKKLSPDDSAHLDKEDGIHQDYQWVKDLDYEEHNLNVLECKETKKEKESRFVWLTNLEINSSNFEEIAKGGRLRWKIENEGFNTQKNGGYRLEHPYSLDPTAIKNFYFFLQIAHIINQLMEKGSLLKNKLFKVFGSIKNFSAALLKAFTSQVFHFDPTILNRRIQIRFYFDTS